MRRRYHAKEPLVHDPDDIISLNELFNVSEPALNNSTESTNSTAFYPYPNRNLFLLGDWYWNGGTQKLQASFKNLLDIVGSPEFDPEDVQSTKLGQINRKLADNDQEEWMDVDAGWMQKPITITVPY